jgi:hypothetical protein
MFPREDYLKKHGWVEVPEEDLEVEPEMPADAGGIGGHSQLVVTEARSMSDIAKNTGSDESLILSAATAFSEARRRIRVTSAVAKDALRLSAGSGVEIVKVRPAAVDATGGAGPGSKAIVVDKSRGIIGMQG